MTGNLELEDLFFSNVYLYTLAITLIFLWL